MSFQIQRLSRGFASSRTAFNVPTTPCAPITDIGQHLPEPQSTRTVTVSLVRFANSSLATAFPRLIVAGWCKDNSTLYVGPDVKLEDLTGILDHFRLELRLVNPEPHQ
jgi:hypothetical protein